MSTAQVRVIPPGMTGRQLAKLDGVKAGSRGPKFCVVTGCRRLRARGGKSFYCTEHQDGRVPMKRLKRCGLCGDLGHTAGDCWRRS